MNEDEADENRYPDEAMYIYCDKDEVHSIEQAIFNGFERKTVLYSFKQAYPKAFRKIEGIIRLFGSIC